MRNDNSFNFTRFENKIDTIVEKLSKIHENLAVINTKIKIIEEELEKSERKYNASKNSMKMALLSLAVAISTPFFINVFNLNKNELRPASSKDADKSVETAVFGS